MNIQRQAEPANGSQLSSMQQQRYDYLYPIYGSKSESIVRKLSGRGRNSWSAFLDKMDHVMRAKSNDKEYYDALYEQFPLNELVQPSSIIGNVGEVRRNLDLSPYRDKLKIRSEHDFFLVFIVEDVYVEEEINGQKVQELKGYKPIIRVMPEA